ncbi:MAG: PLP-dependent transferase [Verrucomicrobiales bacterium]|nr:PLP-dependent transferase [Verrucomicrobiales bacterium]
MKKRDPFTEPFCEAKDLGLAIPDDEHAVSVCLPRWRDVVGYEEQDSRVLDELECGYPRFVEHPLVAELFYAAEEEFAKKNETALVFPTLSAAWRCADFARANGAEKTRLESYGWNDLTALVVREKDYPIAWKGWQHMGEIVSSRLAEAALRDAPLSDEQEQAGKEADRILRERIAGLYGKCKADDVFLFSSGMAAIAAVHRVLMRKFPELPTIQLEFPYLDALKLQQKCNPAGVVDFSISENGGLNNVADYFSKGNRAAGLFTEVPSNPLLRTGNLREISPILRENGVPLIIDDTVATAVNVDALQFADAVTTSLTKAFSGAGDVAAGSVVLNPESPHYEFLKTELATEESASPLFCLDAIVLEINSRHFVERIEAINENSVEIIDFLIDHPQVEALWHPSIVQRDFYDDLRTPEGGYGGLFSIKLKGGESEVISFYDKLKISKGPSLGTNFSLVCPYTILAHYGELDWAESCGVSRNLIRIWIGLEETEDLIARFQAALE